MNRHNPITPDQARELVENAARRFRRENSQQGAPMVARTVLPSGGTRFYACLHANGGCTTIGVQTKGENLEAGVIRYKQREITHWDNTKGEQQAWAAQEIERHIKKLKGQ